MIPVTHRTLATLLCPNTIEKTHTGVLSLCVQWHGTHRQTNQVAGIEAYLGQNDTVPSVGVVRGGLDVTEVKVLQIQWLLTVPFRKGNQGAHHRVFGWTGDGRHYTHFIEVQQEAGVVLGAKQIYMTMCIWVKVTGLSKLLAFFFYFNCSFFKVVFLYFPPVVQNLKSTHRRH